MKQMTMVPQNLKYLSLLLALGALWIGQACNPTKAQQKGDEINLEQIMETEQPGFSSPRTEVEVGIVEKGIFEQKFFAEGAIKAQHKVDVLSKLPFPIKQVNVQNGDLVKKGDLLFLIEDFELQNKLQQLNDKIDLAQLDYQSILIDLGIEDTLDQSVPKEKMKLALVKSGLNALYTERSLLEKQLKQTQIRSPINGRIANVFAQAHNYADKYKSLCTIVDHHSLEVEMDILETQLGQFKKGQALTILPASTDKEYAGHIASINPVVEASGLIKLKGKITQPNHLLLDGMKARVVIKNSKNSQLIVPKESLVTRQGKDVVFLYQEGKAIWRYVEKEFENDEAITVRQGLEEGDSIIIKGNINLGHEALVSTVK